MEPIRQLHCFRSKQSRSYIHCGCYIGIYFNYLEFVLHRINRCVIRYCILHMIYYFDCAIYERSLQYVESALYLIIRCYFVCMHRNTEGKKKTELNMQLDSCNNPRWTMRVELQEINKKRLKHATISRMNFKSFLWIYGYIEVTSV